MKDQKKPPAGPEQDIPRATSGGGLGQGRETAAGMPEDTAHIGRPGKGMGGTDDTGGAPVPSAPEASPDEAEEDVPPSPPDDLDLPVNSGP